MKIISSAIVLFILPSLICHAQNKDPLSRVDEYVSRWHETGRFHGVVLVAERDKVVYVKGFGYANREWNIPNTPETKFDIGSISKQFTTVMLFQLIQEGKIQLSDKLTDHLPEYRKDTGGQVTIDHLLQQTSGIPCYVRDWRASASEKENGYPRLLRRHLKSRYLVSEYMSGDLLFKPGSNYRYSNSNHYLLGKIIERITGKSLEENLNERILKPLGLTNTGLSDFEKIIPKMSEGYVDVPSEDARGPYLFNPNLYGTGGMYSTVEDLYRWNRALESDQLLSQTICEKISTPYWERGDRHSYLFNHSSLRLPTSDRTIQYTSFSGAIDGFRTDAFRFPETGHIIVILDNSEQYNHWELAPGIYRILLDEPCDLPLKTASRYLCTIALTNGIETALKEHGDIKKHNLDEYDFRFLEHDINLFADNYTRLRRMVCAEVLYEFNTKIFPYSPDAWNSLGQMYALLGKEDLSRKALAKSGEIKKLEDELISLIEKKKYRIVENTISRIRQESPDRAVFTSSRIGPLFGEAYGSQMYDHALDICRLWMLGNPDQAGPYFSLARVYVKIGKPEKAVACYQEVIERFPGEFADAAKRERAKLVEEKDE